MTLCNGELGNAADCPRQNGDAHDYDRPHPQTTFQFTTIDPKSFFGKLQIIYAEQVLKTQLDQLRKSGCYDMFTGKWFPCYNVRRIYGAKALTNGLPPSLFWESDIGKWIEAASYFLGNPATEHTKYATEFRDAIDKLVAEMEAFQEPDGYLNVYFQVVDTDGRFRNLRDMHEMYNAGHLLEGALAHYHVFGTRRFLDVMIRNIDCFIRNFGPSSNQRPGYPGHPELELAVLRLYAVTRRPDHLAFAKHLLEARGTRPSQLNGERFFEWEARQRKDSVYGCWMKRLDDLSYHQAHEPLHEQRSILGHSVRAFYLLTACADFGGSFLEDSRRLWTDAMERKMYVTGGVGSEPQSEGFSELEYYIPSTTGEGGCYAETCASIAAMMTSERILSHALDNRYRDIMELCLYNAVLGGGSLDGKGFSYANKLATHGDESALRSEWFEVCCCPPNLCRTVGLLPGYIWSAKAPSYDSVEINIYLHASATRFIELGNGQSVKIDMTSGMPWNGEVSWQVSAPTGVEVRIRAPVSNWMENPKFSVSTEAAAPGFVEFKLNSSSPSANLSFGITPRLVYPDARTRQDILCVMRGPIVFVAEDIDNQTLENEFPHFEQLALSEDAEFSEDRVDILGMDCLSLSTKDVFRLVQPKHKSTALYQTVRKGEPVRQFSKLESVTFVPWFARGNRGGRGHLRVPFLRAS